MGIEWGGKNERPKHLSSQSRIARFLHQKPGGLRGMLDASIDSPSVESPATNATKPGGPIEMPDAERITIGEQALDAISRPGAHRAEMRSAQDVIHEPNPLDRLQRQ